MSYTLTPKEGCWHELSGTVPQELVAKEYKHAVKEISAEVRLPGFRPGKAPPDVVKARFAEEIKRHCFDHLLNEVMGKEFEARKLMPLDNPKLEKIDWDGKPDGAFSFTVKFETVPQIEPKGLESLTIPELPTAVSGAEVKEALESLRRRQGKLEAVEGRPARAGDVVMAALSGLEKGGEKGGETALPVKEQWVKIPDPAQPHPGDNSLFGTHLIGMQIGETRTFEVVYPEQAPPELAGKIFTMTATANKMFEEKLPVLDDAFAKELHFASLAELEAKVQAEVEREKVENAQDAQQGAILQQLRQANDFPLPESMLQRELKARLEQTMRGLAARGINPADAQERWQEILENEQRSTRLAIHNTLLLDAIAEAESIYPGEAELHEAVSHAARQQGKNPETLRREMEKSGAIEDLGASLRREQVLKTLLGKAKKVPPPPAGK